VIVAVVLIKANIEIQDGTEKRVASNPVSTAREFMRPGSDFDRNLVEVEASALRQFKYRDGDK